MNAVQESIKVNLVAMLRAAKKAGFSYKQIEEIAEDEFN